MSHATTTDGVWRVMRFETTEGKYAEVASNHVGPEAINLPSGYKFVRSTPMVPCDDAAVGRAVSAVYAQWPGSAPDVARAFVEDVLRRAGETA